MQKLLPQPSCGYLLHDMARQSLVRSCWQLSWLGAHLGPWDGPGGLFQQLLCWLREGWSGCSLRCPEACSSIRIGWQKPELTLPSISWLALTFPQWLASGLETWLADLECLDWSLMLQRQERYNLWACSHEHDSSVAFYTHFLFVFWTEKTGLSNHGWYFHV